MSTSTGLGSAPVATRRRRRFVVIGAVALVLAVTVLALVFVPYGSASQVVQVSPGSTGTTQLTIPHAGWVTVHFDHPTGRGMGGVSMHYWMQGSGGMQFDHTMMGGTDSSSFWSWGGTYACSAAYAGPMAGTMPVWVNATWGVL